MIDAKKFMEFFEQHCGVKFIDVQTGENVLVVLEKKQKKQTNPFDNPAYKSDYDLFCQKEGNEDAKS